MTETETIKVVTIIAMSYPAYEKFKNESSIKGMVAVWKNIFKDDDAHLVEVAVQKHISVNKWPPSIAEIREQMVSITHPEIVPPDIAWTVVNDLLSVYSEFNEPNLYELLPPLIARVVETIGWNKLHNLSRGTSAGNPDGMDRVYFMELYKPAYRRELENVMLPQAVYEATEKEKNAYGSEIQKLIKNAHLNRMHQEKIYKLLE